MQYVWVPEREKNRVYSKSNIEVKYNTVVKETAYTIRVTLGYIRIHLGVEETS